MTRLYRRLGARYPFVFLAIELHSALFVVAGTLALFTFYYDGDLGEYLAVLAISLALTEFAILTTLVRARSRLRPLRAWIEGERDPESTQRAWSAAVGLPLYLLKRALPAPVIVATIAMCAIGVAILELSWLTFLPLAAGAAIAIGYAFMIHYLWVEAGMRPVLLDINSSLSPRLSVEGFWAVPLATRLLVALPLINLVTGLVVAALTSDGGGGTNLGVDVLVALLVATTVSLELTVLLSKSILRPLEDVERAVERVSEGHYDVTVPVTTGDELGDLAANFNQMVEGLAERERIREAFGTYLDEEIAEYILSDGFDEEGAEIEVTVLFCDVRDFTEFASAATPHQVVTALNRLFEVIVPIIARHGGHVDKFEGDGLLAVFGAPEPFPDHADRAVSAACEIGSAVNDEGRAGELRVGVGVNTGTVIAGAIGGAGRLNFSVIGGAVNVAARVEARTRETEDNILITGETWTRLSHKFEVESRGRVELRGVGEPVALYAPRPTGEAEPAVEPEEVGAGGDGAGPGRNLAETLRRRLTRPPRPPRIRR
jgi:adenylate cyclase